MSNYFLDTSVIIDHQRRHPRALEFVATIVEEPTLSVVTVAELYAGVYEGEERTRLESFLGICEIVPVTFAIAHEAGLLKRQYRNSHGVGLADALIAASCLSLDGTLHTHNARHFPMIEKLVVPY